MAPSSNAFRVLNGLIHVTYVAINIHRQLLVHSSTRVIDVSRLAMKGRVASNK